MCKNDAGSYQCVTPAVACGAGRENKNGRCQGEAHSHGDGAGDGEVVGEAWGQVSGEPVDDFFCAKLWVKLWLREVVGDANHDCDNGDTIMKSARPDEAAAA